MEPNAMRMWVELIAILCVPITVVGVIWNRISTEKGLSVRSIQFLALGVLIPVVLILALEGILERSAVGALFGTLIGYIFANIGKYEESKYNREKSHPVTKDQSR